MANTQTNNKQTNTDPPVECPRGLKYWTADEVSERISYGPHLPGSYGDSEKLSFKLWGFLDSATNPTPVGQLDGRYDEDNDDKAPNFWDRLTRDEQIAIARGYLLEDWRTSHVNGRHAYQHDAHVVAWHNQYGNDSAFWANQHITRLSHSLLDVLGEELKSPYIVGPPALVVEGFKIHGERRGGICDTWIDVSIRNDDDSTEVLSLEWNGRSFQWTDVGEAIELGADPAEAVEAFRFLPVIPKVGR